MTTWTQSETNRHLQGTQIRQPQERAGMKDLPTSKQKRTQYVSTALMLATPSQIQVTHL